MAIRSYTHGPVEEPEYTYPKLMISVKKFIVLFSKDKCGTILHREMSTSLNKEALFLEESKNQLVGDSREDFIMSKFKNYSGKIALQNA